MALVWGKVARSGPLAHHRHVVTLWLSKCILHKTKFLALHCKHARHHVYQVRYAPCHQLVSVKLGYGSLQEVQKFSVCHERTKSKRKILPCQHLNRNGERHQVQPCEGLAIAKAQNSNRLMHEKRFSMQMIGWLGPAGHSHRDGMYGNAV